MFDVIFVSVVVCLLMNYIIEITRRQLIGRESTGAVVLHTTIPDVVPPTSVPNMIPPQLDLDYPQGIFYLQGTHGIPREIVEGLQEDITPIRHVFAQVAIARVQDLWVWRCITCTQ